ncbi:MAG: hypothetical protein H7227_00535 [Actinobacteria bacterium]|nr:hypothetical protein [Actinomycetota bacterium]
MTGGTAHQARRPPKIYAHRGASADFPEHTHEAYSGAVTQGVDGFECDVRLTKDGVAILWHDADMGRVTQSRFLGTIADLTYNDVRNHYSKVMTLGELLDLAIVNKKDLAIEAKHPVLSGYAVEREIARQLNSRKLEVEASQIAISVMSFSWLALEFFHRLDLAIEVNLVMLLRPRTPSLYRRFTSAKACGPNVVLLKKKLAFFKSAQKSGVQLFVWTVDQVDDMEFCWTNGVDVIITNKPGRARKVLGYP